MKIPPGRRTNKSGRPLKETLSSRFSDSAAPFLRATPNGDIVPDALWNKVKTEIYTAAVAAAITAAEPNVFLGVRLPLDIDPSEQLLPHVYRTTLSQLRLGKCSSLHTYKHFIKAANSDVCPKFQTAPHLTLHLFSCPAYPTTLTAYHLWRHPVKVAELLQVLPSFNHLPPFTPRLPLPPPEPPP
jgi:hypothetical protein